MATRYCRTDRAGMAHFGHLGTKPIRPIPRSWSVVGSRACSQDLPFATGGLVAFSSVALCVWLGACDHGDDGAHPSSASSYLSFRDVRENPSPTTVDSRELRTTRDS